MSIKKNVFHPDLHWHYGCHGMLCNRTILEEIYRQAAESRKCGTGLGPVQCAQKGDRENHNIDSMLAELILR